MTQPAWLYPSGWPYPQTRPWAHRCALEWDRQPYRSQPEEAWLGGLWGLAAFHGVLALMIGRGLKGPLPINETAMRSVPPARQMEKVRAGIRKSPAMRMDRARRGWIPEDLPSAFRETAYRGARPSGAVRDCAYSDLGGISVRARPCPIRRPGRPRARARPPAADDRVGVGRRRAGLERFQDGRRRPARRACRWRRRGSA